MEQPQSYFTKHPNNPIFGDEKTGTLFDVYVTPQKDGLLRMDLSWRTNNTTVVSFSEDGVRWNTLYPTLAPAPKRAPAAFAVKPKRAASTSCRSRNNRATAATTAAS